MRAIRYLALTLLVTGVLADDEDRSVAADDLALLAHRLHRRSYLHDPLRMDSCGTALAAGAAAATTRGMLLAAKNTPRRARPVMVAKARLRPAWRGGARE